MSRLVTADELIADRKSQHPWHHPSMRSLCRAFSMSKPSDLALRGQWQSDMEHVIDAIAWDNPGFNRANFRLRCNQL